jgi:hypothetical protein
VTSDPHPDFASKPAGWRRTLLSFLRALLSSPTGEASLDDGDDNQTRRQPFPDGGKWRGNLVRALATQGIIHRVRAQEKLTTNRSSRKPRKGGELALWRLANPEAARLLAERVAALLGSDNEPEQRSLFD